MSGSPDAKAEWVGRVLGVRVPIKSEATLIAEFQAASAAWQAAVAAVDKQMSTLKAALLASGDLEYEDIAETCLDNVIGQGPRVLQAVLQKIGPDAKQLQQRADAVLHALATLFNDLKNSEAIAVCEANPVRAPVAIRARLLPQIARLQDVLRRAAN